MIQVCDPPRVRPVRRFSAEEFCFLLRGEAGSLYRPRSEVLRMLTVGEVCGVCDAAGAPAGAVLLQPLNADTALAAALRELQMVTVAFSRSSIMAAGLPTTRLRPTTTARLPERGTL